MEADDPYFRSNIQLLADSGVLSAPVNSYPLPWALIADDLKKVTPRQLSSYLQTAYYHVRFVLQRAEKKRFQANFKVGGENSATPAAFGQTDHHLWGMTGGVEYVSDFYAFRMNGTYSEFHGDSPKFSEDGSYFAINMKAFSFNFGRLERWWGPSWQSTLSQGQNARPMPALALNYADNDIPFIENLFVETFVAIVDDNSAYLRKVATRISTRPFVWIELASDYTYHWDLADSWGDRIGTQENDRHQIGMDFRISVPMAIFQFQPGIYGQWQKDSLDHTDDSFIAGVDFSGDIYHQQVRFIAEYKNSNSGTQQWIDWLSSVDQAGNESILFGDVISVGTYIQFSNDHKMNVFVHHEKMQTNAVRFNLSYQLPFLYGQLVGRFNYTNAVWEKEHYQGGLSWEYRF
ncbi:MAG: capsule assembly Wzi family protein [Methyloprofundus sp.]|nr:capsule assembly Wzi family protein [Methyloprofundus sp.]